MGPDDRERWLECLCGREFRPLCEVGRLSDDTIGGPCRSEATFVVPVGNTALFVCERHARASMREGQ